MVLKAVPEKRQPRCVKRVLSSLGPWSGPAGRANPNK